MSTENRKGLRSAGQSTEDPFIKKLMQAMVNKAKIFDEDIQPRTTTTMSTPIKTGGSYAETTSALLSSEQFVVDHLEQMGASEGLTAWVAKYVRLRHYQQGDGSILLPEDKPFLHLLKDQPLPPEPRILREGNQTNPELSSTRPRLIVRHLKSAVNDTINATALVSSGPTLQLASTSQAGGTKPWPKLKKIDLGEAPLTRSNSPSVYPKQAREATCTNQKGQTITETASTIQIAPVHTREQGRETESLAIPGPSVEVAAREPLHTKASDGARPSTSKDRVLPPPQLNHQQEQQPQKENKRYPTILSPEIPNWSKFINNLKKELNLLNQPCAPYVYYTRDKFHFEPASEKEYYCILRHLNALKEEVPELEYYTCSSEDRKNMRVALRGILTAPLDSIRKAFGDLGYPVEVVRQINTRDGQPSGVFFVEFAGPPRDISGVYSINELLRIRVNVEPWRGKTKKRARGRREQPSASSSREHRP